MAATYSSLVGLSVGGKYEVRRVLGVGGMGVVCEAVHLDLGKKVAIKLIDKTMKESELIVARFRREWQALGKIQSEHIVDVFDVGADPRVGLYMVMEHLAGEDLQSRLEREKRLDLTTGVMIAHQVARGLEKAHAAGVVHRDLKPANVFLTKRDNGGLLVKLLDFGVSKVLGEAGGARITGSGAPIGTPLYMSPEQAEGKDDTDARADIWSLGALVYEALAGSPPFADRGSYHGTIVGILTSRAKLLHDAAPWVPIELAKVVDAMLVHDRDARIKDAGTVTKRLLEAYPTVLPDGTGRHTAVIVPTTAAVDATGDTEIFTSQGFKDAFKELKARASKPDDDGAPEEEDSKRTVPNVTSNPGVMNEALRTAAATPIEMGGRDSSSSSPPVASGITSKSSRESDGGPKTHPMPWGGGGGATSSASGVAMPGTPPIIEPLPHDVAPDTQRDEQLAMRAERRRMVMLALVGAVILAVAAAGYLAGQRNVRPPTSTASPSSPTPSAIVTMPMPTSPPSASAAPASSAPGPIVPAPGPLGASSAPGASGASGESAATPPASSAAPGTRPHRRPRTLRPATTAPEGAGDKPAEPSAPGPAVPENPFGDPK